MSVEIKIPAVGESITSGILSVWHKKDGETVTADEVVLTLETDKVSTEVNAPASGVLQTQVEEGEEVKIGQVVASIDDSAAEGKAEAEEKEEKESKKKSEAKSAKKETPDESEEPKAKSSSKDEPKKESKKESGKDSKTKSSPKAESGSEAKSKEEPAPAPADAGTPPTKIGAPDDPRTTRRKLSPLRRKIASQLVTAQHTAAILTTFNECDMSAVMKLRKEMQEQFTKKNGVKLGFMSFFIKSVVDALKVCPAINSRMDGDTLVENHYFDIGVAVGTERGLIVPVVRDCDSKSFAEIEKDLAEYAEKARQGKISLADLQGGVFTLSNGGVYGSLLSTPILNPPQSGILGMHKIQERPMAEKGQVVIRPMMYLALSYDHRVVDGKEAVTFLVRVKDCLENPARLLLGT